MITEKWNLQSIINKINEIITKGETVKMKNKDRFKLSLDQTKEVLENNFDTFNNMRNDNNLNKIMDELNITIADTGQKLNNLALIRFCRDKAEKYLERVTEKLHNIYIVLISLIAKKPEIVKSDNGFVNEEITRLNDKIKELELILNTKREVKLTSVNKPLETLMNEGMDYYLGLGGRVDYKKAYRSINEASDRGSLSAKILLARMYENGEYIEKSIKKAIQLYKEASIKGSSIGSYMIARYAETGTHNEEGDNHERIAMKYYLKSSEQGNSAALTRLGLIHEHGLLSQMKDLNSAIVLYQKAVEIDENPEALNALGSIYYKGTAIKQNLLLAVECFQRSAKLGNLDAINNIGLCYEYGNGVEKNFEQAMTYFKKAADKMHSIAIANQAILIIKQNTTLNKKDYKDAFRLLQLSSSLEKENKDVFYHLGYLYENGLGVEASQCNAFNCYRKSMKMGNIKAKTKIGVALFNGIERVVERDEALAIQLLTEAADANEHEAANYLGLLYENGSRIVPISIDKSIHYLKKSSVLGNEEASINLALVLNNNSGNELTNTVYPTNSSYENIHKLSKNGNEFAKSIIELQKRGTFSFKNIKYV